MRIMSNYRSGLAGMLNKDIRYQGSNQKAAEAVTKAIKRDILSMQMLYGKAHSH